MKIDKIYQKGLDNQKEVIYELDNGNKIIMRSDDKVKKLNIEKWEEISFIPESFKEVQRELDLVEKNELKRFLTQRDQGSQKDKSIWKKIKSYGQSIFKRFKKQIFYS